ncbi:MAG TPA: nucleotidyltransferase domain-containing protein [Bacteroidota bacterium]|nr:nucleotidyltransferase domain-containing protein [Bacteroidota bacterium]
MTQPLTTLQKDIVRTLAYFDNFAYPLSADQVKAFLPRNSVSLEQLEESLENLTTAGFLRKEKAFYFFADRSPAVVASRIHNEQRASRMKKKVLWISFFLRQVPFVRAVFVTGSLSKNVAGPSSDVDFMIVTAKNRLWVSKMILTAIRRTILFGSTKYFCCNLFVTEDGFMFFEQNIFNAIEIATTQVLWNEAAHRKFQSANSWIERFLPNWRSNHAHGGFASASSSFIQSVLEKFLNMFPLSTIDAKLMDFARTYWKKRNIHLDEHRFNSLFLCTPDISTVWYDDHQRRILSGLRQRLTQLGVDQVA